MIVLSIEEFAAKRRGDQDSMEKEIFPEVHQAIEAYPVEGWYNDLLAEVARLYLSVFHNEGGSGQPSPTAAEFTADVRTTLDKTKDPTPATVDRLSVWLATAILNAGTQAAAATDEEFLLMEWVTMHDEDVRPAHVETAGQQRPPGEPFDVSGASMRYPGDPLAPIELWINCRCTLAPLLAENATFKKNEGVTMTATETETETVIPEPLAWHGVLAPEGEWSGDGRMFAPESLRFRDLPLPLTWQKATNDGHDGSIVVGKIEAIERKDSMMYATGHFLQTPEADEVVGLIADFGRFGVSVDADDAEFEFDDSEEGKGKVTFTSARIASASVVSIPAFAEAYIALGEFSTEAGFEGPPADKEEEPECDPEAPDYEDCLAKKGKVDKGQGEVPAPAGLMPAHSHTINWNGPPNHVHTGSWTSSTTTYRDVSTEERKKDADAGRAMPDGSYPIDNCSDLKNAIQAIGRAKDPGPVKAHIRKRKKALGCPDVELPESWSAETFDRGPGWVTNPEDTKRLHDYWTRPGEEGYAKIGWGKGGDFNRCRTLVGEKIAANSPEDLVYLNQICARWHHDALGIWPGEHTVAAETLPFEAEKVGGPSVALVASAATRAPAAWFTNPNLSGPTHLTITEEGRVFGHIAEWQSCHIGYEGVCVAPPQSSAEYAYYATGSVLTDDGGQVRTGVISLGGGHAEAGLRPNSAKSHYDSTSVAVADVAVGEDEHGIWCAGWVRPGVTDEQVVALRASDVSGDWREIAGELELVAALAVNVGGFPVVSVHEGRQTALVAAGCIHEESDPIEALAEQIEYRLKQRELRRLRMKELVARVGGE